jgi:hypothetical protein
MTRKGFFRFVTAFAVLLAMPLAHGAEKLRIGITLHPYYSSSRTSSATARRSSPSSTRATTRTTTRRSPTT